MSAPAIVWFEDFQLTQNAGGTLPERFQNGRRNTSLIGFATSVGISVPNGANGCLQPKVTDAKRGWLSLPHMHKLRLDFPKEDIQAVKCGFLPSMSAVSPN